MAPTELRMNVQDGVFYTEEDGRLFIFSQKSQVDGTKDIAGVIIEGLRQILADCEITDTLVRSDSERVSVICWAEADSSKENKRRLKRAGAIAI